MIKRNKDLQALIILWAITLFSCVIVYFNFIFGNEFFVFKDVGSDTFQQYLMHYNSIINAMRDGNLSSWDFTNGLGTSLYDLNFFHPLLFLIYLAGAALGPMRLPHLMVFLEIGQIFLAVTVLFFFLKEFSISRKARVIASYIYGFNAFLIVWGQHYQFGIFVILLPLLLLLLERALKKRRFSLTLSLAVAITVVCSVYMSYMTLLTVGLYLVLRILSFEMSLKERIAIFLKSCYSILLGLGMSAIVFVPASLYLLSTSARLTYSDSLLERFLNHLVPYSNAYYQTLFYRFFSSNLQGIYENYTGYQNYYEAPVMFLTGLFIILLLQYIFTIHKQTHSKQIKALQYATLLIAAFLLLIPSGSLIYNAFAASFSRHTFIFMPFACLLIAVTLDQIFTRKLFSYLGLGIALILFGTLFITTKGSAQASPLIILCLGIAMMVVVILIYNKKVRLPQLFLSVLLLVLVMTNGIYDSYNSTNNRDTLKKDDGTYFDRLYGSDITSAINYLHSIDNSFYRMENTDAGVTNSLDSLAQNYFGISTYNSTINNHIVDFIEILWPNLLQLTPAHYNYSMATHDAELASLLNIKYLISQNPNLDVDGFVFLEQFGHLYIFQNTNTNSIGKFFTKVVSAEQMSDADDLLDIDGLIGDTLVLDDADFANSSYEKVSLADYSLTKSDYHLENSTFTEVDTFDIDIDRSKLDEYERVYLDCDITLEQDTIIEVWLGDTSVRYLDVLAGESTNLRMRLPGNSEYIRIRKTNNNISGTVENISFYYPTVDVVHAENSITNFDKPLKDNTVTGTANLQTDGLLMLSIPHENGWHAYVDGMEVPILRGNYAFITLDMTAGEHDIRLEYRPVGLHFGTIVSICAATIFIAFWLFRMYQNKKIVLQD